jgi:hypothetical protein
VKPPSPPTKAILINGKFYAPMPQTPVKPIVVEGVKFIPLQPVT